MNLCTPRLMGISEQISDAPPGGRMHRMEPPSGSDGGAEISGETSAPSLFIHLIRTQQKMQWRDERQRFGKPIKAASAGGLAAFPVLSGDWLV